MYGYFAQWLENLLFVCLVTGSLNRCLTEFLDSGLSEWMAELLTSELSNSTWLVAWVGGSVAYRDNLPEFMEWKGEIKARVTENLCAAERKSEKLYRGKKNA